MFICKEFRDLKRNILLTFNSNFLANSNAFGMLKTFFCIKLIKKTKNIWLIQ